MEPKATLITRPCPVYCLGDSHVSFFSGTDRIQPVWPERSVDALPVFRTFHLGPVLAYNLHLVIQQRRQKKPLTEIAAACVQRYAQAAEEVADAGFQVMIYNAIPSEKTAGMRNGNGDEYVAVGSCRERNLATRYFNEGLKAYCRTRGWLFLENFDCFVFKNGLTDSWYFMDRIHLSQRAMPATLNRLRELLRELGIAPQVLPQPPTGLERWKLYLKGRGQRFGKELGKGIRGIVARRP